MDPTIQIDLSSIAGIVALTMTIVHFLKPRLGRVQFLQEFPVWLYVVVVSGLLTWFAHDILHKIDGELPALALQAVMSALTASGVIEFWRTKDKPMAETTAAVRARDTSSGGGITAALIPLLLVMGLSSTACASMGPRVGHSLTVADDAIHDALAMVREAGQRACASHLMAPPQCAAFGERFKAVVRDADDFNRAVVSNTSASIPTMIQAMDRLATDVVALLPPADARVAVVQKVNEARAILRSILRGGR